MTEEELSGIRERAEAATPGPWEWAERRLNKLIAARSPAGKRSREQFVYCLKRRLVAGSPAYWRTGGVIGSPVYWRRGGVISERRAAEFNEDRFEGTIAALCWYSVNGGEVVNAAPGPADAEFIAHAREDVEALLAEVDALRAENAGIKERLDAITREAAK